MPAATLAASDFIQLTTFRRTGEGVPTPVWLVPDGDALAVFTPAGTGKLKRIAHTPRVTVAECDRRGRVARLLAAKYGLQFKAFMLIERIAARGERRRAVIHIVPRPPAAEADAG